LAEIVVADAGPLIAFGRLVLGGVFDRVTVQQLERPGTVGGWGKQGSILERHLQRRMGS